MKWHSWLIDLDQALRFKVRTYHHHREVKLRTEGKPVLLNPKKTLAKERALLSLKISGMESQLMIHSWIATYHRQKSMSISQIETLKLILSHDQRTALRRAAKSMTQSLSLRCKMEWEMWNILPILTFKKTLITLERSSTFTRWISLPNLSLQVKRCT